MARQYFLLKGEPDRVKVVARDTSYHGTTLGALSITGIPKYREPFDPMLVDIPICKEVRGPGHSMPPS